MEHGSSSFSFATQRKVAAGCRVCEGTLFTPKIKENRYCYQSARKKIACGAQCGYSFLIGGGAARLAETRPLKEERVVRPPPCVRDPTVDDLLAAAMQYLQYADRRAGLDFPGSGFGGEGD